MHELIRHESYTQPEQVADVTEAQLTEITEEDEEDTKEDESVGEEKRQEGDLLQIENVKIVFLSKDMASEIHKKKKYQSFFDVVYFSNR